MEGTPTLCECDKVSLCLCRTAQGHDANPIPGTSAPPVSSQLPPLGSHSFFLLSLLILSRISSLPQIGALIDAVFSFPLLPVERVNTGSIDVYMQMLPGPHLDNLAMKIKRIYGGQLILTCTSTFSQD